MVKSSCCSGGNFNLKCVLIDFVLQNLSLIYFVYQKSLKIEFNLSFQLQNSLLSLLVVFVVKSITPLNATSIKTFGFEKTFMFKSIQNTINFQLCLL